MAVNRRGKMIPSTNIKWLEYEPYYGFTPEEEECIDESECHDLYGLLWYIRERGNDLLEKFETYNKHVILCVWFKNGATIVMSMANLLGGVCDCCSCSEIHDEVMGYKIGIVEMNFC